MKRFVSIFMVLSALLVTSVASAAPQVCMNTNEQAFTFDLSNVDWFAEDGATNVTSIGLSLYNLDTVGTFGSFMRINTTFDDLEDMFQPESKYSFAYGTTLALGEKLYGYGGLGFVSDFGHNVDLVGTATYGILYSGKSVIIGFGDDTNVGATVSLGGKF